MAQESWCQQHLNLGPLECFTLAQVELAVRALEEADRLEEIELIESSRLLYDGVRDIRRAVLVGLQLDQDQSSSSTSSSQESEHSEDQSESQELSAETMRQLPEGERSKILEKVEEIKTEQSKFEEEVGKWEEEDNKLITLAKVMLKIMLEMTDFTKGLGPITTSLEMIRAAQMISQAGTQLDKMARVVAEQCGETRTRQDLLAYLQRIALYCHQLNICSKVADRVEHSHWSRSIKYCALIGGNLLPC